VSDAAAKNNGAAVLARELRALRAEIAALRSEVAELKPIAAVHPVSRRGKLSDPEVVRLCAWLEQHRDDWAWLPNEGTVRGWLNGRSRPSRLKVAALWLNRRDAAVPGLGRPEPELLALLEGEGEEGGASGPQESEGAPV
jgi:hypothetical protein